MSSDTRSDDGDMYDDPTRPAEKATVPPPASGFVFPWAAVLDAAGVSTVPGL